jgi:GWxTD domain-containing protein
MRIRVSSGRFQEMRYMLAVVAGFTVILGAFAAERDTWDTADAKWRQGPAKYLLTKEEDQAYKKLKVGEDRTTFVEEFWAKRDPSPDTPENEYRVEFYRRAHEAASLFAGEGGRGWQDERGHVFILLGKPDDIVAGTSPVGGDDRPPSDIQGATGAAGGYGGSGGGETRREPTKTVKFIYQHDPMSGKEQRVELDFTSEVTGGYRLQSKLDWNHPFLRGLAHPPKAAAAPKQPASGPPAASPPTPPPPTGEAAPASPAEAAPLEVTAQSELMAMVRSAPDGPAAIPLDVTANFYKAADQSTFATLTLEIKRSSLPADADPSTLVLSAEVLDPGTGESLQRFFKKEQFGAWEGNAGAASGDSLLYQAQRPLKPGKYKAVFAIKEPASGTVGKLEKELEVPDYAAEGVKISTVTLAQKLDPLVTPPSAGSIVPFVLGSFSVVPKPGHVYKPDEELTFYYQIYGAQPDPVINTPKVDISYTVEFHGGGQWRMLGNKPIVFPNQTLLVHAYGFPLRGRPPGEYRLTVKVADTVAGKSVSAEVPFTIAAPPSPAKSKAKSKG